MKVVNVITPHFTPEITAAAHRMDAVVNSLSREYKVNVFTLTERGQKAKAKEMQVADNVTVHSINLPGYTKSHFFIRALFELFYSVKLSIKASKTDADITLVTSPYMFLLPAAILFSGKGKMIADVRDLVWCYLPKRNWIQVLIRKNFEKLICRYIKYYDHITVTNTVERNWLLKHAHLPKDKISILSNGISEDRFNRLIALKYHRKNSPFVITYVGNIGNGQDLQPLVDTVKDLKDVKLNIIGDGIEYKKLQHHIREEKISNIYLHGKLKWSRVLPFYQSSSVLFARLGQNYDSAIPSKLFEYLCTGLPIVFYGSGAASEFLQQFDNTYIIEDENPLSLKRILIMLRESPSLYAEANRNKIEAQYIRENINSLLFPKIESLLNIPSQNPVHEPSVELVLQEDAI